MFFVKSFLTCELQYSITHLSRLMGILSHPDMQKIKVIGFFFQNKLLWQLEAQLFCLQYVPASKPFDHA